MVPPDRAQHGGLGRLGSAGVQARTVCYRPVVARASIGAGFRRATIAGAALLATGLGPSGAAASVARQPETCPNPGPEAVTVAIAAPEAGATVSGVVAIEGTVESAADVFRVEVFVGDARKDVAFPNPPSKTAPFTLTWDSGNRPPGPATIRVQACGGQSAQGSLVRGVATVEVNVVASAGPPAAVALLPAGDGDDVSGGPLWVGLLVGVSGLAGLAVASRAAQTRAAARAERTRTDSAEHAEAPDSE